MGTAPRLRWRLADDNHDGQAALFEEEVERHVGKGEFRGLEFLHVNARTIINEVPAASHLPFRFTINAYRGCSHACTYCNLRNCIWCRIRRVESHAPVAYQRFRADMRVAAG